VNDETPVEAPLLPAVARGDLQAFQACINRYGSLVWSIARRLSTPHDAEDAVQEVFLDLWKNAARFDPHRGSERVFIALCARRRLIDRLRRLGRQRRDGARDFLSPDEAPEVFRAERDREILEAQGFLALLPPQQRHVLTLSLVLGLSHQEIADETELPVGTVKTLLRRGILRVQAAHGDGVNGEGEPL